MLETAKGLVAQISGNWSKSLPTLKKLRSWKARQRKQERPSDTSAIVVQYCVYFGTMSCGRQELNECLTDQYVLAYVKVEFCERTVEPKLAPKESSTYFFQF